MDRRPSDAARDGVRVSTEGAVRRITLDRPHMHNALDDRALSRIVEALTEVPHHVQVIVFDGVGPSFCSGGERLPPEQNDAPRRAARLRAWDDVFDCVTALAPITVACLRGHCIGGGALLALCCDLRIGDETVSVRVPEVRAGLSAQALPLERIHGELGSAATRDLLLTGRRWTAVEAAGAAFLRVVPADELNDVVRDLVEELAGSGLDRLFQDKIELSRVTESKVGAGTPRHPTDGAHHG